MRRPGSYLVVLLSTMCASCGEKTPRSPTAPNALRESSVPAGRLLTIDEEFARVAREVVPGFGGLYFDEFGVPVVWLKDAASRSVAQAWVNSLRRLPGALAKTIATRVARYDWDALNTWRDSLRAHLSWEGASWLDIDDKQNKIVFAVQQANFVDAATNLAANLGVPPDAISVEVHERPRPTATELTDWERQQLDGGYQVERSNGGPCTLGFKAYWSCPRFVDG